MADKNDKKIDPADGSPEPTKSEKQSISEDYAKASPKDKLKKFKVDPFTKTLRRA